MSDPSPADAPASRSRGDAGAARNLVLVPGFQAAAFGYAAVPFLWFLTSAKGLGLDEYAALQSVYYGTTLATEVPTGLLADRVGRKTVLALACIAQTAGFVAMARAQDFAAFAAAEVLLGLGQAMLSGTTSAVLYDSLQSLGREREYLRHESRATVLRLCGTSVAFLVGGILGRTVGLVAAAWASAAFSAGAFVVALCMREPEVPHALRTARSLTDVLRGSLRDLWTQPELRWVAAVFALLFVELRTAFHFYAPGLQRAGVDEPLAIGATYSALNIAAAISTRAAPRFAAFLGEGALLVALSLALSASFAGLGLVATPAAVLGCFFLQQVPFGVHFPIVASYVNHRVTSERRATTLSCLSLVGRASFALAFPLAGASADHFGLPRSMLVFAAAACAATLALGSWERQRSKRSAGTTPSEP